MRNLRNYYRILHVERDAPAAVIKGSYRTLMQTLRHHPDLGGDERNAQLLNEAMATLGDPVARARYDATLAAHPSGPALRGAPAGRGRDGDVRSDTGPPGTGASDVGPDDADPGGDAADDPAADGDDDVRHDASHDEPARGHRSRRDPSSPEDVPSRRASPATPAVPLAVTPPARRCPFCDRAAVPSADAPIGPYAAPSACAGCGGPIAPPRVGVGIDGATERRRSPRLDHETTATLRHRSRAPEDAEDVTVLELSGNGCVLESATPVAAGDVVLLRARTLSAIATVRSCDASARAPRRRIALAFLTVELHASAGSFVSRAV